MNAGLRSAVYWSLPYELRRLLFRAARPQIYAHLQARRHIETKTGASFKPFDDHECIFVHIPKCAGVSLCKALFGNRGGGHTTIRKYQIVFSKREFESYFKFTFVRNPWDRLVSAYFFLKAGGFQESDRVWAEEHLSEYRDFDDFVKGWLHPENVTASWNHFLPQSWFVCGPDGDPQVDFVGYYERLAEDYDVIRNRIGTGSDLTHRNKTRDRRKDFRPYYSDEAIEVVANVYRDDIQTFGYAFETGAPARKALSKSGKRESST